MRVFSVVSLLAVAAVVQAQFPATTTEIPASSVVDVLAAAPLAVDNA